MKPTVSTNTKFKFFILVFRIVESKDAKSISLDSTFERVKWLNKVDLPEFV